MIAAEQPEDDLEVARPGRFGQEAPVMPGPFFLVDLY